MSTPAAIFFLCVLVVGLPASLRVHGFSVRVRNATALAIVATWLFGQLIYALTGEWLPLQAMVLQDMVVVATMFAKQDWQDCSPYPTLRRQIVCFWLERSPWDRAILALFAPAWLLYAPILDPLTQFWTLWSIGLAQLMLAGAEAFHLWQKTKANSSRADAQGPPPRLDFYAPAREWGYG